MSDQWEVKKVEKSGDGFWINVQPNHGSDDTVLAHVFNILILSVTFMTWFGLVGVGWWAFCAVIAGIFSVFLFVPSLVFSLATFFYFIFW